MICSTQFSKSKQANFSKSHYWTDRQVPQTGLKRTIPTREVLTCSLSTDSEWGELPTEDLEPASVPAGSTKATSISVAVVGGVSTPTMHNKLRGDYLPLSSICADKKHYFACLQGLGGLAAAAALTRMGVECRVYEKVCQELGLRQRKKRPLQFTTLGQVEAMCHRSSEGGIHVCRVLVN